MRARTGGSASFDPRRLAERFNAGAIRGRDPSSSRPGQAADDGLVAIDDLPMGIVVDDGIHGAVAVNEAWCSMTNRRRADCLGHAYLDAFLDEDRLAIAAFVAEAAAGGPVSTSDWQLGGGSSAGSAPIWLRLRMGRDAGARHGGGPRRVVVAVLDVTAERENEMLLSRRATHDPLTDLPNRDFLVAHASVALRALSRGGEALALFFIDIDDFAAINARFGHRGGDVALQSFAECVTAALRPSDVLTRYGGDEFVLVSGGLQGGGEAPVVARRVLDAARRTKLDDIPLDLRVSIGIAVASGPTMSVDALIANADHAMYRAKRVGGGCWQSYSASMARAEPARSVGSRSPNGNGSSSPARGRRADPDDRQYRSGLT